MRIRLRLILLAAMISSLGASGGGIPEPQPLVDLDTSYLAVDLQLPWRGDPFRKVAGYAVVKVQEPKFVLGGIAYSEHEREAIVNGESVVVGDEIDGRIVDSIGRNYVVLRKGDSLKELVLPPEDSGEEDR